MTRTVKENGIQAFDKRQRYAIEALLQTPMSLREIGEVIGVSKGTVSHEARCSGTFSITEVSFRLEGCPRIYSMGGFTKTFY